MYSVGKQEDEAHKRKKVAGGKKEKGGQVHKKKRVDEDKFEDKDPTDKMKQQRRECMQIPDVLVPVVNPGQLAQANNQSLNLNFYKKTTVAAELRMKRLAAESIEKVCYDMLL